LLADTTFNDMSRLRVKAALAGAEDETARSSSLGIWSKGFGRVGRRDHFDFGGHRIPPQLFILTGLQPVVQRQLRPMNRFNGLP
jgi:hypothetical protein